jgi:hypothetical protein
MKRRFMFDPLEFIALAKTLSSQVNDEKVARTCVGRAYYAAHLKARETIRRYFPHELQSLARGADEHRFVRERLIDRRHGTIASKLLELSRKRGRADYDLSNYSSATEQTREVMNAIQLCENIISLLGSV